MNHRLFVVRLFEIIPGFLTWMTFLAPVALSFVWPKLVATAIMIYALFWFFRTLQMSFHLIMGFIQYRKAIEIDWLASLKKSFPKSWDQTIHLVFIPMYKEDYSIVEATIKALIASDYPIKSILPVVCTEERAGEVAQTTASQIKTTYGSLFYDFYTTTHPSDLPGEVRGKGPNITFAAKQVVPEVLKSVPTQRILVTTLDADNRVDPKYFSCVTQAFLASDDPKHSSYQPLSLYFNNIWDVPLFIRVVALGASFWVMVQTTRPGHLRNFSAHSQSLEGLIASDYWSVATIVEDGHQYWRSLFRFGGKHHVIPIFVPIYQDAVLSYDLKATIREQYLQKRRWAWGVSDISYVFYHNLKDRGMTWLEKWSQFLRLLEGHYSWATTSILLSVVGWIPLVINQTFQQTVFGYNFPNYYSKILTIAGIGMIVSLTISTLILPKPKSNRKGWMMLLDWLCAPLLLPLTSIFFGAIPAIDSQTRLMFGKYFEVFHVTEKKSVVSDSINSGSTD